jgi:hypothetical protein
VITYHPDKAPDSAAWLAVGELERIEAVEKWHRRARIRLPNRRAHAIFHTIVENQLAENLDSVVRALSRLIDEGLSRHDAVHAISWILANHIHELLATRNNPDAGRDSATRYSAAVERLTARAWLEQTLP